MRSASFSFTPKVASLKYLGMSALRSPGDAYTRSPYIFSSSEECFGRGASGQFVFGGAQAAKNCARSVAFASPFAPGGRMFQKPPPSLVPYGWTGVSEGRPGRPGSCGSPGTCAAAGVARAMAAAIPAIATQTLLPMAGQSTRLIRAPRRLCASTGRCPVRSDGFLGEHGYRVRGDRLDLLGGALELLVGEHGRALEREVAIELEPRAAAVVLGPDLHGHRPRDPVRAQHHHVQRVAALPGEPLLRVVGGPHVVGRQRVDGSRIRDQVARRDLRPGANPDPLRLRDPAVLEERLGGRLVLGPDALLEGARELGNVRGANEVVPLVVERGVEEEPVVLDLEVLVLLTDPAFA